jgi:hypothetical protein
MLILNSLNLVNDKIILCKVTSRGRPDELIKCIKSYLDLAHNPTALKWLFSFDVDDEKYASLSFTDSIAHLIPGCTICFGKSNSKIDAINRDVEHFTKMNDWHILVNISDDQLAEVQDWDKDVRETMPNHLDASLWYYDGRQQKLNTMEIVGRKYYERFGYIYYPEYKSFFCDNEAHEVAERDWKLIKTGRCIVKHYHIGWTKDTHMKHDETYKRAEANWGHDEALYKQRKANGFPCKA